MKQKPKHKYFLMFFFCVALKTNDTHTYVVLVIFLNALKKVNNSKKLIKWHFWQLIAFFSAFSKILTKRTFMRQLFLKLNHSRNTKKTFFGEVFLKKPKNLLFGGFKIVVFKPQILNCFSAFVLHAKGSFIPIFTKLWGLLHVYFLLDLDLYKHISQFLRLWVSNFNF